jgi:glycosyltransferase involved in cell wall biosynthesis
MEKKITEINRNEAPRLSVCLVTYNQEFFIERAIESVIAQQTAFAFELVIGEDCSTDGTRAICEQYRDKYPDIIRLLPSDRNLGLKENFLRTFRACRGEYIAYLEGDDYWLSDNKLQMQADMLDSDREVSLVHTNCRVWDVLNNRIYDRWTPVDGVCVREKNIGLVNVIAEFEGRFRQVKTSSCCYRRALLEEILEEDEFAFRNPEFPTQDFQLFLELSMKGRFAFIAEEMTMVGLHNSLSAAADDEQRIAYRLGFYKIGIYYIRKYALPQKAMQIWVRKQLNYLLNKAFRYGDERLARTVREISASVGYRMPVTQRVLYYGACFGFVRMFVRPLWEFWYRKRNQCL